MEPPRKKLSSPSSSSSPIKNLPSYILMEILCRLQVKTLVASKCVCKSWLRLIKDPDFIELHQLRAPTEVCSYEFCNSETPKLYMGNFNVLKSSQPLGMKIHTLFKLTNFKFCPNNAINFDAGSMNLEVANSCNGLLCFRSLDYEFAVIWNPITSEAATFPAPKPRLSWTVNCVYYGLGFSRKVNRFKLLRVVDRMERESCEREIVAEICTIEKGCSWKDVGPFPHSPHCCFSITRDVRRWTFLRGALHWFHVDSLDPAVYSFDFEDDRFGEVPLPPRHTFQEHMEFSDGFGVLAGCLYITESTDDGVNIWLMKEYGVQDSWTKILSLECRRKMFLSMHCVLITDHDNGDILLTSTAPTLDSYNSERSDMLLRNPALKSIRVTGSYFDHQEVIAIRPSLIPLKDSVMGYDVHAKPRCPVLKHKQITTTPSWWKSEVCFYRLQRQKKNYVL